MVNGMKTFQTLAQYFAIQKGETEKYNFILNTLYNHYYKTYPFLCKVLHGDGQLTSASLLELQRTQ